MLRIAWPKKVIENNKAFSSLIIKVVFELIANRLLNYDIIELNSEYNCVYFEKKYKVLQCFKYYKHGYIIYAYKNGLFYYKYEENHEVKTYANIKNEKRCLSYFIIFDYKL